MNVVVITPPSAVVTWDDAKRHLRLDDETEKTYVEGLAAAALAWVGGPKGWLGRAVGAQSLEYRFCRFAGDVITLPVGPITAVTTIKYLDVDGAEQTYASANYQTLSDGRIVLKSTANWPDIYDDLEAVRIRYDAGEATPPEAIKQALLLLIGHWYQNRETVNVGNIVNSMPFAVEALLSTYRAIGPWA